LNNVLKFDTINFEKDLVIDKELTESIYSQKESVINLPSKIQNLQLIGDWKLEIDFNTYNVTLDGNENGIENLGHHPSKPLKLSIYFSKTPFNQNELVNGFEFQSINLPSIKSYSRRSQLKFETNITKMIPKGIYYPILVLAEQTNNGEFKTKNAIQLGESYQML